MSLATQHNPAFIVVDETERDILRTLSHVRAILIVDEIPRDTPSEGARVRLLVRPFAAEQLLAEVSMLLA